MVLPDNCPFEGSSTSPRPPSGMKPGKKGWGREFNEAVIQVFDGLAENPLL